MIADQRAREMGRDGNQLTNGTQHLDRAYSYEDEGEFEQALEECDKVIATARFPLVADAYNLRGIILEELGRSEEAVEAYTKAIAIMPGFREAADNLHELEQELSAYYDLVAIATFCDPSDALEMKRALELKGIWVIVGDEREIGMDAIWVGDWRGAKLQVKEHDVNSALAVLGIETEHLESDACKAKARGEIRCPDCASSNLRYERYSKWGVYGAWQRARPGGRFAERKWLCRDCGYVWSVNEE